MILAYDVHDSTGRPHCTVSRKTYETHGGKDIIGNIPTVIRRCIFHFRVKVLLQSRYSYL